MPVNWTTSKLADIATILGGGTPSRAEPSYFGGDLPWVTPTDLAPIGKIVALGDVAESLTRTGLQNSSAKLIPAESVLFSSRASIGKIAVTDRVCATNQGFINLTPKKDIVCPWFLAYLLGRYTSDDANARFMISGTISELCELRDDVAQNAAAAYAPEQLCRERSVALIISLYKSVPALHHAARDPNITRVLRMLSTQSKHPAHCIHAAIALQHAESKFNR